MGVRCVLHMSVFLDQAQQARPGCIDGPSPTAAVDLNRNDVCYKLLLIPSGKRAGNPTSCVLKLALSSKLSLLTCRIFRVATTSLFSCGVVDVIS